MLRVLTWDPLALSATFDLFDVQCRTDTVSKDICNDLHRQGGLFIRDNFLPCAEGCQVHGNTLHAHLVLAPQNHTLVISMKQFTARLGRKARS